ncbi:DUF2884 domain-containing protein [Rouxiella badensis]|jgi:hypothetical protein|uniref:DUF2884 domain-containing protein n=2 Tax=Rouxiella badensis TaxID=1646377 RepID=A0A1X0W9Z0_9GAMM|nr:DUF2884 domain-containing protein [Rouxiella badensis]MCC3705356.1 DUF2884 domain-containing protein [Rouxiella badensis]MCC3719941.1 DUF2884 domain-containing protein [Rouxiella badensis]MCC3731198.1 DUF2884 domain-containing protein [Rouxiella badensis]MCC3733420.1 DUF2884 domain-containing protein [Rouxiella badensis]MCC3742159.1 DUF2884 domain-containing protein [Rouxiella badensis]
MLAKTGLKHGLIGLLALTALQAHAEFQCSAKPKDDIVIKPDTVQVVGASGNLLITQNGSLSDNGKDISLTARQRQEAVDYQAALRRDLPWIDQGARAHLEKARVAMDGIIVQQLGPDSNVRNRLTKLDGQLKAQMNRVIEHRPDGLTFHHQAIDKVQQDGQHLVEQTMGGVMQDSMNEMGTRQMASGGNPLQAMMSNLGGLQQAVQAEWKKQQGEFEGFGHSVCNRVTSLEQQRRELLADIKP